MCLENLVVMHSFQVTLEDDEMRVKVRNGGVRREFGGVSK